MTHEAALLFFFFCRAFCFSSLGGGYRPFRAFCFGGYGPCCGFLPCRAFSFGFLRSAGSGYRRFRDNRFRYLFPSTPLQQLLNFRCVTFSFFVFQLLELSQQVKTHFNKKSDRRRSPHQHRGCCLFHSKELLGLVGYLSKQELRAILGAPDRLNLNGRRDYLVLALLYDTGARVQKLVNLCPVDFRLDRLPLVRIIGRVASSGSFPCQRPPTSFAIT